jgi:CBS-domain-containing membrane protein
VSDHFLTKAKAYAALIGSVLTVLATQLPSDPDTQKWLGIALALCTAVATFAVPNKPKA